MRGVAGSEYEGGLYHLRIILPHNYPMAAPDIILLTPNGRFELGKKICIDGLTSFHAGSWQPAWGVRTALTGLRSFWMQGGEALSAIGALDCSREERRRLAKLSQQWTCPTCQVSNNQLLLPTREGPVHAEKSRKEKTDETEIGRQERVEMPLTPSREESDPKEPILPPQQPTISPESPATGIVPQADSPVPSIRPVPKWIDIPLGILCAILGILVVRRVL
ncbi:ubiquitin-conjugating enzyme/RWD-like protein [Kockovaella imperatae]|uniref:Ubiquitin-conjugating enzyme/RWD-like protein n=1 Tax=Kockovaella imperatae TaxID=4999 RepID=A0A1Y1ULW2_9TREE|nr:ubiquitin-conjugating enzyme/RWD-like protein [Kockovaella imperatae]ORX38484.1 ubiquitin-conjugating enzyme/RWD-like protein [Kockovaella imperatae]